MEQSMQQGGTADYDEYSSLTETERTFLSGIFLCNRKFLLYKKTGHKKNSGFKKKRRRKKSMYNLSLAEAEKLSEEEKCKVIPLCREIYADVRTPIEVLRILKNVSSHCYILESVEDRERWGRYTFLGYDPSLELTVRNGHMTICSGTQVTIETKHPKEQIRRILAENKSVRLAGLPPFTGGLVGYFSYDYMKYREPSLKLDAEDKEGFYDADLMLFDKVIAFDNLRQKIMLITNIRTEQLAAEYEKGILSLKQMEHLILRGRKKEMEKGQITSEFTELFDEASYCRMVEKVKEHIREGDIFQAVLSNCLEADFEGSLFDTYRALRVQNPSPYMFYFSSSSLEVAGASPETLVKVEDRTLHTFPLAGTRPRGRTPEEDEALEKELLSDEKECAEHNMLVDLGRNDIGRVSEFGSVEVETYMSVERFSHVMHIGSTVKGTLRKELDALDALDAVLPAGTLSGAPKIKACEIINSLEGKKRGIYGGAIGYIDFTGNLDTCIAIRFACHKGGKVYIRSGAGIVADSVPKQEYRECIQKAGAVRKALMSGERTVEE